MPNRNQAFMTLLSKVLYRKRPRPSRSGASKGLSFRKVLKPEDQTSSLPANAQRPAVRIGDAGTPAQAQLRLTVPHLQVGTVDTVATRHRAREVDDVLIFHHDGGVMAEGEDALHGRTSLDVAGQLVPTVIGTALAVRTTVIMTEPEGLRGKRESIVEGHDRLLGVPQLLVLNTQELAAPQQSRARVTQGEEREIGVLRDETLGDLRDAREVGLEGLGLHRRVATEAAIEETLGLDPPLVDATSLEPPDQVLDLGADAFLTGAQARRLDLVQFGHMANIEHCHLNLRKSVTSQGPKPYVWYADRQICTVPSCRCVCKTRGF